MKYLKDFNQELAARHKDSFESQIRVSEEDFYRDSERFITIQELIELSYQDIEDFYDKASVGQIDSQTD